MQKLLIFVTLFIATSSYAEVAFKIKIRQSQGLTFDVQIENTEKQSLQFLLSSQAKILKSEGVLDIQKSQASGFSFKVKNGQKALISYFIPLSDQKTYFVTAQNKWIPVLENEKVVKTFQVRSQLQNGFHLIESATGQSQDDLDFVFGRFKKYVGQDPRLQIYLTKEDDVLAGTLLEKLVGYMKQFEADYGAYPYSSFAFVESPDEIGFAFPKMTWMGSQLLRFPFILTTSLPHELLHSWWGNGVFVDYSAGNWCEGLTAFGADYGLLSEDAKKNYRLKALTNYANYVREGHDLPLSQFISRGEDRSLQAIGYDKAMMVFVMLEQQIGASHFKNGLREFYRTFKFKKATYSDLFQTFERVSGQKLKAFESYWIQSTGSIGLNFLQGRKVSGAKMTSIHWIPLAQEIRKIPGQPLETKLISKNGKAATPVALQVRPDGQSLENSVTAITSGDDLKSFVLDPNFLLFRSLHDLEKPVTFSKLFGENQIQLIGVEDSYISTLKAVFPDKEFVTSISGFDANRDQDFLIPLADAFKIPAIESRLKEKNISLQSSNLKIENQVYDLNETSAFLTLRIGKARVSVFQINDKLPALRWFQRWSRYGAQSYVVLTNTAAATQGIWLDTFEQPFQ